MQRLRQNYLKIPYVTKVYGKILNDMGTLEAVIRENNAFIFANDGEGGVEKTATVEIETVIKNYMVRLDELRVLISGSDLEAATAGTYSTVLTFTSSIKSAD